MPIHVATPGGWKEAELTGVKVAVGGVWRDTVEGHVRTPSGWGLLYAVAPETVQNFRATNVGQYTNRVMLEWSAAPRAATYRLYYRVGATGTLNHFATTAANLWDTTSMGYDTPHEFWIEAVDGNGRPSPGLAGPVRVRTGHEEQAIEAGAASTGWRGFSSTAHWRGGWAGANPTLCGWYTSWSTRYHAFWELNYSTIRNVIAAVTPQLNGHWGSISAIPGRSWVAYTRTTNAQSGGNTNAQSIQVQLGQGISYANAAEPGNQGNIAGFALNARAAGWAASEVPWNWYNAIFQVHASPEYNGFLFRARNSSGGDWSPNRYFGMQDPQWAFEYSWPRIVTVGRVVTSWW